MEMDDNKLKRILQDEMNREADRIMEEIDRDPEFKDVVAPEAIHDRLFQQIREHEEAQTKQSDKKDEDNEELIRLGKIYKKKRSRRKYYILVAAVVCLLAFGVTSLGDGEKVFSEMKSMLGDREQTLVNSDDGERIKEREVLSEEDAYEEINEKLGFYPVKLDYLPEGMKCVETVVEEEIQSARFYYTDKNSRSILYRIVSKNRISSTGTDIEDVFIQEYDKEVSGIKISIKEYEVEENKTKRWSVGFVYKEAQYTLILMGIEKSEVEKILENLYFS